MNTVDAIKDGLARFENRIGEARKKNERLFELDGMKSIEQSFKSFKDLLYLSYSELSEQDIGFLIKEYNSLVAEFKELERESVINERYDKNSAILEVKSSAGGKDAMGCAALIAKMYLKWFKKKNFATKITSISADSHEGIKNITIVVEHRCLYRRMKSEHGVHKIIRQSPFNVNAKRQTSFVYVEVLPLISDGEEITVAPAEVKVDVFRASGPGGQSVNTTDSAVRLTHLKTGITVSCQNERSQLKNKAMAMSILESRLRQQRSDEKKRWMENLSQNLKNSSWGHHIRTYTFHPYKSVKDNRSTWKTSRLSDVVEEGAIDDMLEESLRIYDQKLLDRYYELVPAV